MSNTASNVERYERLRKARHIQMIMVQPQLIQLIGYRQHIAAVLMGSEDVPNREHVEREYEETDRQIKHLLALEQ